MEKRKIVATIEARMGSTRLPGKVLMDLGGVRSLDFQIQRLRRSNLIDEIVIATTTDDSDDEICHFAENIGVSYYRGSVNDILSRILNACDSKEGDVLVQVTGDCPVIDPIIVDQVIETFLSHPQYHFVSNEIERSFPIGLDCRVFSLDTLKEVDRLCDGDEDYHRIHGSTYIYAGAGKTRYKSFNIVAPKKLNYPDWRWTLDTSEDLKFFRTIFKELGSEKLLTMPAFELVNWLNSNPWILAINNNVRQKELAEG